MAPPRAAADLGTSCQRSRSSTVGFFSFVFFGRRERVSGVRNGRAGSVCPAAAVSCRQQGAFGRGARAAQRAALRTIGGEWPLFRADGWLAARMGGDWSRVRKRESSFIFGCARRLARLSLSFERKPSHAPARTHARAGPRLRRTGLQLVGQLDARGGGGRRHRSLLCPLSLCVDRGLKVVVSWGELDYDDGRTSRCVCVCMCVCVYVCVLGV